MEMMRRGSDKLVMSVNGNSKVMEYALSTASSQERDGSP